MSRTTWTHLWNLLNIIWTIMSLWLQVIVASPFCTRSTETRFSGIQSFTFVRLGKVDRGWSGTNKKVTNQFKLVMLHENSVYELEYALDETIKVPQRWHNWRVYSYLDSNQHWLSNLESLYYFSKDSGKEEDYDWDKFKPAPEPRLMYHIAIITKEAEFVWCQKRHKLIFANHNRTHPPFTLALDHNNVGYVLNEDIYRATKDIVIYPFEYIAEADDSPLGRDGTKSAIHKLNSKSNPSRYFYMELTENPNEVLFIPNDHPTKKSYNSSRSLLHSLPKGYINEYKLYLIDLVDRCVYAIEVTLNDFAQNQPFKRSRTNFVIESFFTCPNEQVEPPSPSEVQRRCGKTLSANLPVDETDHTAMPEEGKFKQVLLWSLFGVLLVLFLIGSATVVLCCITRAKRKKRHKLSARSSSITGSGWFSTIDHSRTSLPSALQSQTSVSATNKSSNISSSHSGLGSTSSKSSLSPKKNKKKRTVSPRSPKSKRDFPRF